MIHKITYPLLILVILLLGVFAYIKAYEAEQSILLARESTARAERLQEQAQLSAARATEEAARAEMAFLEAEKQRAIALVYEEKSKLSMADVEVASEYKMIAEQQRARADQAMRLEAEIQKDLLVTQMEADVGRKEAEMQKGAADKAMSTAEEQRYEAMRMADIAEEQKKRADSLEAELRRLKN